MPIAFAGATATLWSSPNAYVFHPESGDYHFLPEPFGRRGTVPCDAVGAGCIAIRRAVLEHAQMKAPFAAPRFTEDLFFCFRARRLGFRIVADFDHPSDHIPSRGVWLSLATGDVGHEMSRVLVELAMNTHQARLV